MLRLERRAVPVAKGLQPVYRVQLSGHGVAARPEAGLARATATLLRPETYRHAAQNESRRVEPGGFPQPAISGRRGGEVDRRPLWEFLIGRK